MGERRVAAVISTRELFQKDLTASDVKRGLNRFLVPRWDADKYFPDVKKYNSEGQLINGPGTILQFMEKNSGRWWEFKYRFWASSRAHVFTTNWPLFIKAYGLKEGEVIKFYKCTEELIGGRRKEYLMIEAVNIYGEGKMEEAGAMEFEDKGPEEEESEEEEEAMEEDNMATNIDFVANRGEGGVRLFGVRIG